MLEIKQTKEEKRAANEDQIYRFLESQLKNGHYHTGKDLEDEGLMTQAQTRQAIKDLRSHQRIRNEPLPPHLREGAKKNYLHPISLLNPQLTRYPKKVHQPNLNSSKTNLVKVSRCPIEKEMLTRLKSINLVNITFLTLISLTRFNEIQRD